MMREMKLLQSEWEKLSLDFWFSCAFGYTTRVRAYTHTHRPVFAALSVSLSLWIEESPWSVSDNGPQLGYGGLLSHYRACISFMRGGERRRRRRIWGDGDVTRDVTGLTPPPPPPPPPPRSSHSAAEPKNYWRTCKFVSGKKRSYFRFSM